MVHPGAVGQGRAGGGELQQLLQDRLLPDVGHLQSPRRPTLGLRRRQRGRLQQYCHRLQRRDNHCSVNWQCMASQAYGSREEISANPPAAASSAPLQALSLAQGARLSCRFELGIISQDFLQLPSRPACDIVRHLLSCQPSAQSAQSSSCAMARSLSYMMKRVHRDLSR